MEAVLEFVALGGLPFQEAEDGVLFEVLQDNPPRIRAHQYGPLNLQLLTDEEVVKYFRFRREHLERLAEALRIPNEICTDNRHVATGIQGLCIYLRRLAYPNRLIELEPLFALSPQSLSDIANTVMCIIYQNYGHLLQNLHNLDWLNYNKLQQCAEAVANKGAPVQNCWGFIDGTARSICRPSVDQENYYSGHKRHHCVKYQSVICPDGIVVHLSDAYPGRRHDAGILRETNFYAQLEQQATFPNEDFFTIYGDQAYGIRRLLLCPYGNRNLTPEQQNFNQAMSSVRQAVEWGFGKTIAEFAFLDYKKNQKLLLQDISKMYATATILSNCHTCLYGSQTSQYFNINPPMLEEYLGIL